MENKEMECAQIMMGITALLVVFGQLVLQLYPTWIIIRREIVFTFSISLLLAISGFLFGYSESHAKPFAIIKQKLLSLALPCVFFAFLYLLVERPLPSILDMPLIYFLGSFFPSGTIYELIWILLFHFIVFECVKNKGIAIWIACVTLSVIYGYFFPLCFALAMIAGQKCEALKKRKGLVLKAMAAFALFFYTFAVFCCASPESLRLPKSYNLFARIFAGLLLAGGISLPALASLGLQRIRFARRFFFVCCRLLVANLPSSSAFHEGDTEDHRRAMALVP